VSGIPRVIHGSATGAIGRDCGGVKIKVSNASWRRVFTDETEGSEKLSVAIQRIPLVAGCGGPSPVGGDVVEAGPVRWTALVKARPRVDMTDRNPGTWESCLLPGDKVFLQHSTVMSDSERV
jgi:hypothetical protein